MQNYFNFKDAANLVMLDNFLVYICILVISILLSIFVSVFIWSVAFFCVVSLPGFGISDFYFWKFKKDGLSDLLKVRQNSAVS